jgi:hypothetical protein
MFAQQEAMGGMIVRTIDILRTRFKIGLINLVYNLRRLAWPKEHKASAVRYAIH